MKKLTYSAIAKARLRANKRQYGSLVFGIFLSIFLVSLFVLAVYGVYQGTLEQRYRKVGNLDMVILDNDLLTDEAVLALGDYDRLGHAYVTGQVSCTSIYLGYYDDTGIELLDLIPVEGKLPQNPGEIALEPTAMEVFEVDWVIGQNVELEIIPVDGIAENRTFTLVGILPERSEHLAKSDHSGVSYFPAIVTASTEPVFSSGRLACHKMMGLKEGVSLTEALPNFWDSYLRPEFVSSMYGLSTSAKQVQFYSPEDIQYVEQDMVNLIVMITILASALVLSCCVGISGAMEGVLSKRREEIGVLRAIGSTRRQIRRMFGRENLILALVASPLAIAAACLAIWILALLIPERLVFQFRLWLVLPIGLFSVIVILLSGYLPLVRSSKLMPMSVIRDTAMLRRSKKIRSRAAFDAPKLISARQIRFHPTRQVGASLLVALMLLVCGLTVSVMSGFTSYNLKNYPGFYLNYNGTFGLGYIPTYESESLPAQSIRQIRALDHVRSIRVDRKMPILLDLPNVPRYAYTEDDGSQFGILDDEAFEEALNLLPFDSWFHSDRREAEREEYLRLCNTYGFSGHAFRTSIITIDLNLESLTTLSQNLSDGAIDIDAINDGRAVLVYAPNVWIKTFETGGYTIFTGSPDNPPADDEFWTSELIAWNDTFYAGQTLSMTQLYQTGEGGNVNRHDVSIPVCGVITELPDSIMDVWATNAIITTEQGLEKMKLRMEGLRTVAVYVDDLTGEEEEILLRQLTAISRRSESYSVQNQVEQFRKQEQSNQQTFLLFFSVIILFFTVSVGMIVSSVTRQLHSEGRTIGMLRAVGADEKAILGCYSGQIRAAVLGGFVLSGSLFGVIQMINILNMPSRLLRNLLETALMFGSMIVLTLLCTLLCRFILRMRIREIVHKSIIDNIREL